MNDASSHARHVLVDGGFATDREADDIVGWLEVDTLRARWPKLESAVKRFAARNVLAPFLWLRRFVFGRR